jgi:hypothetical protein
VVEGQREMLGFVTMRLDKDRETIRQFSTCKNVTDALALQSRWMQEMMSDYTAESLKMLSIYTRAGRQQRAAGRGEE